MADNSNHRSLNRKTQGDLLSKQAEDLLLRASNWAAKRWDILGPMLWPGRESCVDSRFCWAVVVNRISEIANDRSLDLPNWCLVLGLHRGTWCAEKWRNGDRPDMGGWCYTPWDEKRIGNDPEIVYGSRQYLIADSETAIEWLITQLNKPAAEVKPNPVDPTPSQPDGIDRARKSFTWGGRTYDDLTERMLGFFKVMHDEYRKGTDIVTRDVLEGAAVSMAGGVLGQVFKINRKNWPSGKLHPASELVEKVGKEGYRLIVPDKVPERS